MLKKQVTKKEFVKDLKKYFTKKGAIALYYYLDSRDDNYNDDVDYNVEQIKETYIYFRSMKEYHKYYDTYNKKYRYSEPLDSEKVYIDDKSFIIVRY